MIAHHVCRLIREGGRALRGIQRAQPPAGARAYVEEPSLPSQGRSPPKINGASDPEEPRQPRR